MRPGRLHIVLLAVIVPLLAGAVLLAQGKKGDPSSKRKELANIKETIKRSRVKLKQLEGTAQRSQAAIAESRARAARIDSTIGRLEAQERTLAQQMIDLRHSRDSLNDELALLSAEYVRMARALFRQRLLTPSASILLMPREHQMLELKARLFERYARRQREQSRRIAMMTTSLAGQDSLLADRQREQMSVIGQRRSEIGALMTIERQHAQVLSRATSETSALRALIARKNAEASQIESMITRLIAEERRSLEAERARRRRAEEARAKLRADRKAAEDAPKRSTATPRKAAEERASRESPAEEAAPRGSEAPRSAPEPVDDAPRPSHGGGIAFRWPTASRKVAEGYGERLNRETNTVTLNPGVNIAAGKGSAVLAAEDGTVSLVSWLPSYGTIVIVEHEGGYRTVYANLAAAHVSRGTDVRRGQRIGAVGESADGEFLHFEVWKDQSRMNPVTVLP